MNKKLSRRIMASMLCLILIFTLAFSSVEVFAQNPEEDAGLVNVHVKKYSWVRQGNSDVFAWVPIEEDIAVIYGNNNELNKNIEEALDDPDVIRDDVEFYGWFCYSTGVDMDNKRITANVEAQYSNFNTCTTYSGDVQHVNHCYYKDLEAFELAKDKVLILGDNLSKEQIETELNKGGLFAVDGYVPRWTVTSLSNDEMGGGSFEANATYDKTLVSLCVSYVGKDDSFNWRDYTIAKAIWLDEVNNDVIRSEVNKLNTVHTSEATFQDWEIEPVENGKSNSPYSGNSRYNLYNVKAKYTNIRAYLNTAYVKRNQDGSYQYSYSQGVATLPDLTDESIEAELNKRDLQHGIECKGWDFTYGSQGGSINGLVISAKAKYDKYPSGLSYAYLNKNNELVEKNSTELYSPDTTFGEIIDKETADMRGDTVFFRFGSRDDINNERYMSNKSFRDVSLNMVPSSYAPKYVLIGHYDDVRIANLYYPIAQRTYTRNNNGKYIASLEERYKRVAIPKDVDTTDEMVKFLQDKGLMKSLPEYQKVIPGVEGFDYDPNYLYYNERINAKYKNESPTVGKTTHTYQNPTFSWSKDGKTCTLTLICDGKNCNGKSHTERFNCTVTSKVKTKATCSSKGTTTYTATYTDENGKTYTDTKDVKDIPKNKNAHTIKTTVTPATTKANGKIKQTCTGCKNYTKTAVINKIGAVKLSATSATYNGKAIQPTVTVTDSKGKTINPKYYTVKYAKNTNVGTAAVKVTFKDRYKGTLSKTFTIVPKKTAVKAVSIPKNKNGTYKKGYMTANWTALTGAHQKQITGYQLQVSADPNFKSVAKTVTAGKPTATTKTITGLKKGKYYVRIRTYTKAQNGTIYYSGWAKWSKTATVK